MRVSRPDLLRRRLTVAEAVTDVAGRLTWGTPKSHQHRTVPLRASWWTSSRCRWRARHPRRWCSRPCTVHRYAISPGGVTCSTERPGEVGLAGLTPHELRHTAASLAVSAGATVKVVQRMLGHRSAAMTLDVYAGYLTLISTPLRTGWTLRGLILLRRWCALGRR